MRWNVLWGLGSLSAGGLVTSALAAEPTLQVQEGRVVKAGDDARPFRMMAHEVRWALVDALGISLPADRCPRPDSPQLPVGCLLPVDAMRIANALSERSGLEPAYAEQDGAWRWLTLADGYHIPSAYMWLIAACEDGACEPLERPRPICADAVLSPAPGQDDGCVADLDGPIPVGLRARGRDGLHDVIGNVDELVYAAHGVAADGEAYDGRTPCCLVALGDASLPATAPDRSARPGMPQWTAFGGRWTDTADVVRRGVASTARVLAADRPGAGLRLARFVDLDSPDEQRRRNFGVTGGVEGGAVDPRRR